MMPHLPTSLLVANILGVGLSLRFSGDPPKHELRAEVSTGGRKYSATVPKGRGHTCAFKEAMYVYTLLANSTPLTANSPWGTPTTVKVSMSRANLVLPSTIASVKVSPAEHLGATQVEVQGECGSLL